eukprot:1847843-Prymnesium_polylepis.1
MEGRADAMRRVGRWPGHTHARERQPEPLRPCVPAQVPLVHVAVGILHRIHYCGAVARVRCMARPRRAWTAARRARPEGPWERTLRARA